MYDDTFALELVSEQLLDKFNFVAGIVPVLTIYRARVGTKHSTHGWEGVHAPMAFLSGVSSCTAVPTLL